MCEVCCICSSRKIGTVISVIHFINGWRVLHVTFCCFSITIKSDEIVTYDLNLDFLFLFSSFIILFQNLFIVFSGNVMRLVYIRCVWLWVYELIVCYIQSANANVVLFHSYSYYRNSLLILCVFINYLRDLNLQATKTTFIISLLFSFFSVSFFFHIFLLFHCSFSSSIIFAPNLSRFSLCVMICNNKFVVSSFVLTLWLIIESFYL